MADRPGPVAAAGGGDYPWRAWSGFLGETPFARDEPDGLGPAIARGRDSAAARQSCRRAPGDERSRGSVQRRLRLRSRGLLAIPATIRSATASRSSDRLGPRRDRSLFDFGVEARLAATGAN